MVLGKLDHIDLIVGDIEKAEEYFVGSLGFKLRRHTAHGGKAVELTSPSGDFFLDLHQVSEELIREWREGRPPQIGPVFFNHISFEVEDMGKAYEELQEKGVPIWQATPFTHPDTGRKLADIADADGRYWIQITEKKK